MIICKNGHRVPFGSGTYQKINMGTELNTLAGFLKLRGGLHQGYPTFGLGIALLIFRLDYAYFTRELGTAPGMYPDDTHSIGITIGW